MQQDKKSQTKDWKDRQYHFDTGVSGDSKLKKDDESYFQFQKRLIKENFKSRRADKINRKADKLSRKADKLDPSSSIEDSLMNTFQEDMQIEMDRAYQESIAPPGHYDAQIEFERNRDLQLELNNIYGFTLEIDGKIGPNTKKAVQLRDSLISKGLEEHDVREYIEGSRMGFPVHLLINGNQELYDKWKILIKI